MLGCPSRCRATPVRACPASGCCGLGLDSGRSNGYMAGARYCHPELRPNPKSLNGHRSHVVHRPAAVWRLHSPHTTCVVPVYTHCATVPVHQQTRAGHVSRVTYAHAISRCSSTERPAAHLAPVRGCHRCCNAHLLPGTSLGSLACQSTPTLLHHLLSSFCPARRTPSLPSRRTPSWHPPLETRRNRGQQPRPTNTSLLNFNHGPQPGRTPLCGDGHPKTGGQEEHVVSPRCLPRYAVSLIHCGAHTIHALPVTDQPARPPRCVHEPCQQHTHGRWKDMTTHRKDTATHSLCSWETLTHSR